MTATGVPPAAFAQEGRTLRFEWGMQGLAALAPASDAIVIVDVLRFTTCVDVAVARGAVVLPYPGAHGDAAAFAARSGAELAGRRGDPTTPWSLSPTDLSRIPAGTRLVLPSPNGSTLAFAAADRAPQATVFAACLRNASAVAAAALAGRGVVSVIAAGERWGTDGALRPALEDLLGAGAVIAAAAG